MKLAKVHYGWVICCACFVVMAFTAPLVNACASLYLPAVTEEFEISRSAFTVTSTLVAMCGLLLSPIWGRYILSTICVGYFLAPLYASHCRICLIHWQTASGSSMYLLCW